MKADTLVLSGGGALLYAHLGAIWSLNENGWLAETKRFVGVSAGAIIALMLAAGLDVPGMCEQIFGIDFFELQSFSPLTLMAAWGLDDAHRLTHRVRLALESLGWSRNITLRQLQERTGKEIAIGATDVVSKRFRFFTGQDDIPAVTALRASIAIPLLYTPVRIHDGLYVDGGLVDNFPLARVLRVWPECTALGIHLKQSRQGRPIDGIMEYALAVFSCVNSDEDQELPPSERATKLVIHLDDFSLLESPSLDRKRELFSMGYDEAMKLCLQSAAS